MKRVKASLNGLDIILHVPETLHEFKEGARASAGHLLENEGYLFNFGKAMQIQMENSGVFHELALLYMYPFTKYGIVEEIETMKKDSADIISSYGFYQIALELRQDFVEKHSIQKGAILVLKEDLKFI